MLLPLSKVVVKCEICDSLATTQVELTYNNPSPDHPYECTYTFPLDKTTVLAKFEAVIDERVVHTKVVEKEAANEQYEDAVAAGNSAVLAERSTKKDETMTVKLGNLMPGQSATLKSTIISQLEVVGGHYAFLLPAAFYPDYRKHGVKDRASFVYEFSYEVRILSQSRITNLSLPSNFIIAAQNDSRTDLLVRGSQVGRTIDLYYRTVDMLIPALHYATVPDSEQVAVAVSLVPTFDPV